MKLIEIFTPNNNKRTGQDGGTWKKKKLKKLNITPKQLLCMTPEQLRDLLILKPKTKFYKNVN